MSIRPILGDRSSIVCFKAVVVGAEDALGVAAAAVTLKAAGRKRGKNLVKSLGLSGAKLGLDRLAATLDSALGVGGTGLCSVRDVARGESGAFVVQLSETICSAGEPDGSDRQLTFTLGAVHGALEEIYDVKLRGKQTESVLRGGTSDTLVFDLA